MNIQLEPHVDEREEMVFVLGNKQVASIGFVVIVLLALCSAVFYMAGKARVPAASRPIPPLSKAEPELSPAPPEQATVWPGTTMPPPAPNAISAPEPPIFANPATGALYLQVGAVQKGVALIFVEGLRKRGFTAFAAPGATEKDFRVLVGPLPTPEALVHAKSEMDSIELTTFTRQYEPEPLSVR